MGMSTRIVGFQPPDDNWKTKKAAWDACETAGVPIPPELLEFFGGEEPDDNGREIDITMATTPWGTESSEGFEIEIAKLPPNTKIIRFYNSW